jgi:mono/diheme cytochrome c family protein
MALSKLTGSMLCSAALALAVTTGTLSPPQAQTPAAFEWQDLGIRVFKTNCGVCHQESGQGIAGAFPPLAGTIPALLGQPSGRDYLIRVVLFGLEGRIEVKGSVFDSAMPGWPALRDDEIAAALDYVLTAWGNDKLLPSGFTPIVPADVAAARGAGLSASQVHALRGQIAPAAPGAAASASRPVTFTLEQAERGQAAYARNCQDCHGTTLDNGEFGGAPLKGSYFRRRFGGGSVAALHGKIKTTMPPDRPGQLSEQTYADLTAFLLSENGYAAGDQELPAELAAQQAMSLKK